MNGEVVVFLGLLGYVSFRLWLKHDKRRMIHRERLTAIEKGVELPAVEQESTRSNWNIQRFLLIAGYSWIAVGVGGGLSLFVVLRYASPEWQQVLPPPGSEIAAIIPIGIGIAHLIAFRTGERRERLQ